MSKAFTKEPEAQEDDIEDGNAPKPQGPNYISPEGLQRLRAELATLMDGERPKVVEAVHWAAKNGDRSENGDYLYGKKRLREIDRRIRFLTKRLTIAEPVDASVHQGKDQVFFGATVRIVDAAGAEQSLRILGMDEADSSQGEISWISPMAQALLKARVGDEVTVRTPQGGQTVEILAVSYPS